MEWLTASKRWFLPNPMALPILTYCVWCSGTVRSRALVLLASTWLAWNGSSSDPSPSTFLQKPEAVLGMPRKVLEKTVKNIRNHSACAPWKGFDLCLPWRGITLHGDPPQGSAARGRRQCWTHYTHPVTSHPVIPYDHSSYNHVISFWDHSIHPTGWNHQPLCFGHWDLSFMACQRTSCRCRRWGNWSDLHAWDGGMMASAGNLDLGALHHRRLSESTQFVHGTVTGTPYTPPLLLAWIRIGRERIKLGSRWEGLENKSCSAPAWYISSTRVRADAFGRCLRVQRGWPWCTTNVECKGNP